MPHLFFVVRATVSVSLHSASRTLPIKNRHNQILQL
jgi:hypothetical protein